MSIINYGILQTNKAIRDKNLGSNPHFVIFDLVFTFFLIIFVIGGILINFTHIFDGVIKNNNFTTYVAWASIGIIVVLIVLGARFLLSSKGEVLPKADKAKLRPFERITGWKAVALFFGIFIAFAIFSIIFGYMKGEFK